MQELNSYSVSLTGIEGSGTIARKDFFNAISRFIGDSRQKRLVYLDETDPESYIIYSTPIKVNDILIKKFSPSPIPKVVFSILL